MGSRRMAVTSGPWRSDTAELRNVLATMSGFFDEEEPVDELQHALQCATHALSAGAAPELVAAALLHDVGRAPPVSKLFSPARSRASGRPLAGHKGIRKGGLARRGPRTRQGFPGALRPGVRRRIVRGQRHQPGPPACRPGGTGPLGLAPVVARGTCSCAAGTTLQRKPAPPLPASRTSSESWARINVFVAAMSEMVPNVHLDVTGTSLDIQPPRVGSGARAM